MTATRFALGLEYCGTRYLGWQKQAQGPTLQDCVEQALSSVADHPVEVYCAGRTDAGVHALCQVVHFDARAPRAPHNWVFGGNVQLPPDISIVWARQVEEEFHARYSATARRYRYLILNRAARPGLLPYLATWECRALDEGRMARAAQALLGRHDFSAYRATECQAKNPEREVRSLTVARDGDFVIIDIEANAFLHHMVRNIAGVLMEIGMGRRDTDWAGAVLRSRQRAAGGVTAPPHGLYLSHVGYPARHGIPAPAVEPGLPAMFAAMARA